MHVASALGPAYWQQGCQTARPPQLAAGHEQASVLQPQRNQGPSLQARDLKSQLALPGQLLRCLAAEPELHVAAATLPLHARQAVQLPLAATLALRRPPVLPRWRAAEPAALLLLGCWP